MSRLADRYPIEREIGSGGMARVFLGADEILDRPVAVKVLKGGFEDAEISERFRREGQMAARLSHPNIVQVYDAGEDEFEGREASYIVMEYLPGGDLKQLIDERGKMAGPDLAQLGADIASGLAHAHGRGVIHRDIKPHNILLGESGLPKLTDFGIARALDVSQMTRTGHYLGTALYSSPEQLRGETATPKSDVYSLGATLYQAATGEPPFAGSEMEVASQHVSKEPEPPRERGASIEKDLERLILECLAKDPETRPSAGHLRERLSRAGWKNAGNHSNLAAPVQKPSSTRTTRAYPEAATRVPPKNGSAPRRRRRWREAAAVLALLVGLGLIAVLGASMMDRTSQQGNDSGGDAARNGALNGNDSSGDAGQVGSGSNSNTQTSTPVASQTSTARAQGATATGEPVSQPSTGQSVARKQTAQPEPRPAGSQGSLTEEAAADTVVEIYTSAASGDYGTSYGLLSQKLRQDIAPTQADWSSNFTTLEEISFIQGPTADVSGDQATVTGTTLARHTNRTEQNVGTWSLVNEGGEWKLDSYTVQRV